MKTGWKIATAVVLIGGSVWAGSLLNMQAEGAGTTPGTADDPVVTKSYVDQAIQQAIGGGGGSSTPNSPSTGGSGSSSSEAGIQIVDVKPGKILVAAAGAEFIVRSGKAVIYSADSNGVADLTDGKDITNGGTVANNHLLSFPREGRGIQVQEGDTHNLTVMVRGGYQIK
ncbi:MAG: hypothetical protein E6Y08_18220 [Paenibacillus sp.]|uniref:hypothetical protein n=1 Tax=Paenibacillus sp. TaxID=58172 RepID=UPI002913ACE6|nr:hypothetical protein [Paenibacillus sp.]MDU4697745.1 hypothetical protein [Paenibacillus sp.]